MPPGFLSWHLNSHLEEQISRGKKGQKNVPNQFTQTCCWHCQYLFFVRCPSELMCFWTAYLIMTSVHSLLATPMQRWKVPFSGSPTLISPFLCKLRVFNYEDEEQEERRTLPYGCSSSPLLCSQQTMKENFKSYFKPCLETLLLQFHSRTAYGMSEKTSISEQNTYCPAGASWCLHTNTNFAV